jgi:D-arginine dehydrogenase
MPRLAVVGAGILGCMVAYEIAGRSPDVDLTLLDQDMAGSGASRRSAGLFIPSGGTARVRRMAAHSGDVYRKLRENRPELPIHPLGMTIVASKKGEERLRENYGAALERTDRVPNDAVTIPPGSGTWDVTGCHYADVYSLAQNIARELRPKVNVREGLQVTAVDDGVTLRLGTGETLVADKVVLAPGPWLGTWESLIRPLGVRVKKIVALHVEQRPDARDNAVFFPDDDAFLLPLAHRGHWLFSYTCREWDVDPNSLSDGLTAENLAEARGCLRRYAPSLVEHCTAGRVFCDAYSSDGEPEVRTLDDVGRIVFAGAANGSGYRLAPAIASEAADLLHLPTTVWSHS